MTQPKRRVVIIGGNFAGLVAASRLSRDHEVTVVDVRAEFEWTPNIHEILSGVKSREGVVLSRERCIRRYGHHFLQDRVSGIDHQRNVVLTEGGAHLCYDACLVAAGSDRTTAGVEGADRHAQGFRWVDDAVKTAERLDRLARRKRPASVVIVGGGVTGVEVLGEILRRRRSGDDFKVHLVEAERRLLPGQSEGLARDAIQRMAPHGVTLHKGLTVREVGPRSVVLADGSKLSADLCIWSAGMKLPDFLSGSRLNPDGLDWLPVDESLRSRHADNIFVAGDCAELPQPARKQAFNAIDMGAVAGDNIERLFRSRPLKRFRAAPTPLLISFGDLTTWLDAGVFGLASPALAAAKEAVYQVNMARFASPREPLRYSAGVADRAVTATRRLLLPQLLPSRLCEGVTGFRVIPGTAGSG